MCGISVYSNDESKASVAACISSGRMEVFAAVSGAVIVAKFVTKLFTDSAVSSIA